MAPGAALLMILKQVLKKQKMLAAAANILSSPRQREHFCDLRRSRPRKVFSGEGILISKHEEFSPAVVVASRRVRLHRHRRHQAKHPH